jgi:hypothetical protein
VVLAGGGKIVTRVANWARIKNKPLLPVVRFGGKAKRLYFDEISVFENKYSATISKDEFEILADIGSPIPYFVDSLIRVAQKICCLAFAIMAFNDDYFAAFEAIRDACQTTGYECCRIDEEHNLQQVSKAILDRIEGCAFAIVDISSLSPNVFYELGYAHASRKKFILTAKQDVKLPFDVQNIQVLRWNTKDDLAKELPERIRKLVHLIPSDTKLE